MELFCDLSAPEHAQPNWWNSVHQVLSINFLSICGAPMGQARKCCSRPVPKHFLWWLDKWFMGYGYFPAKPPLATVFGWSQHKHREVLAHWGLNIINSFAAVSNLIPVHLLRERSGTSGILTYNRSHSIPLKSGTMTSNMNKLQRFSVQ